MNLIVDSGATKANWSLSEHGRLVHQVQTPGLHPLLMPDEILNSLVQEAQQQGITSAKNVFYYGTGCKAESSKHRLGVILRQHFPMATVVEVDVDVLGAARALCQHEPGIACILGTGSNSCFYDGKNIINNKGGHGFILGDEGSGAALGKRLLADFLNHQIPEELHQNLIEKYQLVPSEVIESTYRRPNPSRYLASFAPFLLGHQENSYVRQLIENQMAIFLERYVIAYEHVFEIPIHFVGSIAWHFKSFVEVALQKYNLKTGIFLSDPMEGLIKFHSS